MVNKEVEQWAIHGVIPGDYETYERWIIQKDKHIMNLVGGGIVFHDHGFEVHGHHKVQQRVLYAVTADGRCRHCGDMSPPGVRFRAKTCMLQGAGFSEDE